jgi:hypothetical protein
MCTSIIICLAYWWWVNLAEVEFPYFILTRWRKKKEGIPFLPACNRLGWESGLDWILDWILDYEDELPF